MKNTILTALVGILVILVQSCGQDENLISDAQASIEMKAVTQTGTVSAGRIANTGYTFTEVMAGVTEIELETLEEDLEEEENGEAEDEEIEFEGNFIINLLTGVSEPDFGLTELLPGVYQEVEIEFDNILEGGKTLIVNFNFTPEGSETPTYVEFSTEEEFELEIENEAGFLLDEGSVNAILVQLDLDLLFGDINFNSLGADEDGVIRINENSNDDLMYQIVEMIEDAMEAEEDDEDDDKDEDDD